MPLSTFLLLYRIAPEGFLAAGEAPDRLRLLVSDPFEVPESSWEFGRSLAPEEILPMAPVLPSKVVGFGRTYRAHAAELGNAVPAEPLLFLKAPSSIIGTRSPVLLPPESERVEFEGEVALVIRRRISRIPPQGALASVLGVTCACDVTARDLQRRDAVAFARGKSFDTFCPLGPAIRVRPDYDDLEVVTRLNGVERQRGRCAQLIWPLEELVSFASHMMTLEPGDILLTGTPKGVGPLAAGDRLEVEVIGVGVLDVPVEGLAS